MDRFDIAAHLNKYEVADYILVRNHDELSHVWMENTDSVVDTLKAVGMTEAEIQSATSERGIDVYDFIRTHEVLYRNEFGFVTP